MYMCDRWPFLDIMQGTHIHLLCFSNYTYRGDGDVHWLMMIISTDNKSVYVSLGVSLNAENLFKILYNYFILNLVNIINRNIYIYKYNIYSLHTQQKHEKHLHFTWNFTVSDDIRMMLKLNNEWNERKKRKEWLTERKR